MSQEKFSKKGKLLFLPRLVARMTRLPVKMTMFTITLISVLNLDIYKKWLRQSFEYSFLRRCICNIAGICHKSRWQNNHIVHNSLNLALSVDHVEFLFSFKVSAYNYHTQNFNLIKFKRLSLFVQISTSKFFSAGFKILY